MRHLLIPIGPAVCALSLQNPFYPSSAMSSAGGG
jgi:hypothetical protein